MSYDYMVNPDTGNQCIKVIMDPGGERGKCVLAVHKEAGFALRCAEYFIQFLVLSVGATSVVRNSDVFPDNHDAAKKTLPFISIFLLSQYFFSQAGEWESFEVEPIRVTLQDVYVHNGLSIDPYTNNERKITGDISHAAPQGDDEQCS